MEEKAKDTPKWKESKPYKIFIKILKCVGIFTKWYLLCFPLLAHNYYSSKINIEVIIICYIIFILNYHLTNKEYKKWQELAEHNEFYKKFTTYYNPVRKHLSQYILIFALMNFVTTFEYIVCLMATEFLDTVERRFYTLDIKTDIINEKIERNLKSP